VVDVRPATRVIQLLRPTFNAFLPTHSAISYSRGHHAQIVMGCIISMDSSLFGLGRFPLSSFGFHELTKDINAFNPSEILQCVLLCRGAET
jgi:hypothetical protein